MSLAAKPRDVLRKILVWQAEKSRIVNGMKFEA